MKRSLVLLLGVALSTSACFHYVRVEDVPDQGTPVRAHLAQPVSLELADLTAHGIVGIQGEVVSSQADRLVLSAFRVSGSNGFEHFANGETVEVRPDAVGWIEVKRLAKGRSVLAAAGLIGAGVLLHLALDAAVGSGEGGGPPGPIR